MAGNKKKLEKTLIKNFCFFSFLIVLLFALVVIIISTFNNSLIVNTLEDGYIANCEGKNQYSDIKVPELEKNGGWFEVLDLDFVRQYPVGEYKRYANSEIVDLINGDYILNDNTYRGVIQKFYNEEGNERILLTFFPSELLDFTPTINIPLELEAFRFLAIYVLGIIIFMLGYFLTVLLVSKKVKTEITRPINTLKEAMKELGSGKYEKRLSLNAEYEFVDMAESFNRMAEEMAQAVKEKEDTERLRRQLISDISHDVRTPLTVIQGYLVTVINNLQNDKNENVIYLQRCYESSVEMEKLIQQLCDYNRLFRLDYKLNKEILDLTEFVKKILIDIYHQIEVSEKHLIISLDEQERNVLIDKREMRRAILNLIGNAVQHNETGTTIAVQIKENKGKICVIIADNGEAIPERLISYMYEPFIKGEQSRNDSGNSGLGLAIVKKVVNAHGADMLFEQPYEEYTKAFIISIKK